MPRARQAPEFDVAVLGGGPAGATAAFLLARMGHRVALITRPAPRPALAESLPPSCVLLLEKLGLFAAVRDTGFVRATGNTARWGATDERVEMFQRSTFGFQVARDALDALLLRAAAGAGAWSRTNALVRGAQRGRDGRWTITYEERGKRRALVAARVLDCTGRAGVIARRGTRRAEKGWRTTALACAWTRKDPWGVPDETHTVVESGPSGWAWSVPVSRDRRHVTVMLNPSLSRVGARGSLDQAYARALADFPGMARIVKGARRSGRVFAREATPYRAARASVDGALLVGDAASFVDPLSSFGVKKALASAWLASVVTHSCLVEPAIERAAVAFFERREREMYASLHARAAALARDARTGSPGFWTERDASAPVDELGDPDVEALRTDPQVLAAFEELKRRPAIALRLAERATRVRSAAVRGQRIVLEEHLTRAVTPDPSSPAIPPMRWIRNVDLLVLADLAPHSGQVPDLFDAYNRSAPPVPLPDFLGALSVLLGKGVLTFA